MATTEFSCDVWSAVPFIEGSKVTFNGYLLPDFYITQQSYSGGVASITAYDLCKNLDIPFDYSGYDQLSTPMTMTATRFSMKARQSGIPRLR